MSATCVSVKRRCLRSTPRWDEHIPVKGPFSLACTRSVLERAQKEPRGAAESRTMADKDEAGHGRHGSGQRSKVRSMGGRGFG